MEAKRILPWEHYDDGMDEWTADTEIRRYRVDMDEGLFSATGYTSEWDYPLGEKCGYSSLDAALEGEE